MEITYEDIQSALDVKLISMGLDLPVFLENMEEEPLTGTGYIAPKFIPTSRKSSTIGENPDKRIRGIYRIYCYFPSGKGPLAASKVTSSIVRAFDNASDVSYTNPDGDTIVVTIDYSDRNMGRRTGAFWQVVVDVGWHIYGK